MATDGFYDQEKDFSGWPDGQDEHYTLPQEPRESFFERHELEIPTFIMIGVFIGFAMGILVTTLITG